MKDDTSRRPAVHALLKDGTTVRIRTVELRDHDQPEGLYTEMSPDNRRLRSFSAGPRAARLAADTVCAPARRGHRALLAERAGQVIGLVEYHADGDAPHTAELAVAVADGLHDRGVGTLLVEHLVSAARADCITSFTADVLSENHEVLRLFAGLGLAAIRRFDGPEAHCVIDLHVDETYLTASEARGRAADVAGLEPLLRPRSIAVVGAGRRPGSVGRALLHHLREDGFTGRLFAVNPAARAILGVSSYPSVGALPVTPDLVVVASPAGTVPAVAEECGKAGVRALVVVSAGLDTEQSEALLTACRAHGMRLVGPNCLGVANTAPGHRFDATFAAAHPRAGTAGVAVQSGGVGIALLEGLSRLGIGVSTFASLGDKYDVSGNDLLQWRESDGRTDLALLHLESFGNPRAFSRTARRVTRRMPVLTVDAGRTDAGRRAAASHTAAAATGTMTRQALFTQAGITATRSVGELLEAAALLHAQPPPAGARVAVITNAGGAGVLAADACAETGLTLNPPSPEPADDLLAEADFNPVLATPGGVTVPDARIRLLPRRPQDPYLRRPR
nr:GNAT family N-acetyltransferase [Streptomyces hirsutus]